MKAHLKKVHVIVGLIALVIFPSLLKNREYCDCRYGKVE